MAFIESDKGFDKDEHQRKMKKRLENMDSVQYPLKLPANIYKKLKVKAAQEEKSIKAILMEFIDKYLSK